MSRIGKKKIEIPAGTEVSINGTTFSATDTNTTYSVASSGTLGLVKIGYSESGKNYPVELSSEKMYVNVPWTDTDNNTTYTAGQTATILNVGTVVLNSDGSYTFTPDANYNGTAPTVTYETNTGATDTLDVTVVQLTMPLRKLQILMQQQIQLQKM